MAGDLQADRAQAFAALLRQPRERVFAERAILCDAVIAALLRLAQWLGRVAFVLDVHAVALPLEFGLAGAVGTGDPASVDRVQDRLEVLAVVDVGRRHFVLADEATASIGVGVQLVAVEGLAVLLGPARLHVLLRPLGGAPVLRDLLLLDRLVLLALVALNRSVDDARIDDLAATRQKARAMQLAAHRRADVADQDLRLEPLAPHPDRLGIGHPAAVFQALEAGAIQHLVLQRVVRQVVQLLQQQQLDHHHRRVRRSAAATGRSELQLGIHHICDRLEVDVPRQQRQRVVQGLALGVAFFAGEQADHRAAPRLVASGRYDAKGRRVFRGSLKKIMLLRMPLTPTQ